MYLVETVGRAIPCFRHGTDYILNLLVTGPSASYAKLSFARNLSQASFRILVLPLKWQPMSRYTAVGLLHIPLGIALSCYHDLGFTDKAEFSLMCYHIRRLSY